MMLNQINPKVKVKTNHHQKQIKNKNNLNKLNQKNKRINKNQKNLLINNLKYRPSHLLHPHQRICFCYKIYLVTAYIINLPSYTIVKRAKNLSVINVQYMDHIIIMYFLEILK
jgi:hypothetical protein